VGIIKFHFELIKIGLEDIYFIGKSIQDYYANCVVLVLLQLNSKINEFDNFPFNTHRLSSFH